MSVGAFVHLFPISRRFLDDKRTPLWRSIPPGSGGNLGDIYTYDHFVALSDLRREMVLAAIRKCDQLGRDAFLEGYGS
jgi:hypothetical protein